MLVARSLRISCCASWGCNVSARDSWLVATKPSMKTLNPRCPRPSSMLKNCQFCLDLAGMALEHNGQGNTTVGMKSYAKLCVIKMSHCQVKHWESYSAAVTHNNFIFIPRGEDPSLYQVCQQFWSNSQVSHQSHTVASVYLLVILDFNIHCVFSAKSRICSLLSTDTLTYSH